MFEKLNNMLVMECDKAMHAFYGLFLYSLFALYSTHLAIFIVLLISVGKEVYDAQHKDIHTPDIMDAVYTFVPAFAIYFFGLFA